jgi:hypothetical protein
MKNILALYFVIRREANALSPKDILVFYYNFDQKMAHFIDTVCSIDNFRADPIQKNDIGDKFL